MAKVTYERIEKQFINPYNFVELKKTDLNNRSSVDVGSSELLYTGKLHCKIYPKTPLAIPDVESMIETKDEGHKGHKEYSFFEINGKKVIPGSTLRGMLRTVHETITDSCFVTFIERDDSPDYFTERIDPKYAYKPGILIKNDTGQWELYRATRCLLPIENYAESIKKGIRVVRKNDVEFKTGDRVCIQKSDKKNGREIIDDICFDKNSQNLVFVGEPGDNKKYHSVFKKQDSKVETSHSQIKEAISRLEYTLGIYGNESINQKLISDKSKDEDKDHNGYRNYDECLNSGMAPIWYKIIDKKLYLSMAAIGRRAFYNTMETLSNKRSACDGRNCVCPSCTLFGKIRGEGVGSKIRISDAILDTFQESSFEKVTLKELGSPKSSYLPFYSVNGLSYDDDKAAIRGRKFYWHNLKAASNKSVYQDYDKTKRNATMELLQLKNSPSFSFDVFYDNITKGQLDDIIWTITLGENQKDSNYCHKIGHGKPIGLGSVKIVVESDTRRTFSIDNGYSTVQEEINVIGKDKAINQLLTITDITKTKDVDVRYPYIVDYEKNRDNNDYASFHWFAEFKKKKNGDNKLPSIEDCIKHNLRAYKITQNKKQYVKDNIYDAVVGDRAKDIKYVKIKLKDGGVGSIPFKNSMKKDDNIKVIYKGMKLGPNGKMYHNWELKKE